MLGPPWAPHRPHLRIRAPFKMQSLEAALRLVGTRVVPALLVLLSMARSRRVVHGLQTLIAKGRKNKNRTALLGNFAPVKTEVTEENLKVTQGSLPPELKGVYMRNGSNPYFDPVASYHWFEGDGMIHALRIHEDGHVSYCNRYMDTSHLAQEKRVGKPLFAKFGDQEGVRGVLVALLEAMKAKTGILDTSKGTGTANTSVIFHANKILALHEGDLPYQVRMLCSGVMETVGRTQIGTAWGETHFTAHPKLDADSGDLHFLGYDIEKPLVSVGSMDKHGDLQKVLKVPLPWTSMMHDMAITPRFKLLMHLPLVFDPQAMIKQNSLPIVYKSELPARLGLVPHGSSSPEDAQWFELPSFMAFHVANAWEEGPLVKLYVCAMSQFDMGAKSYREELGSRLTEFTLDTRTGTASSRQITSKVGDFPIVHPLMQGRRTRYMWWVAHALYDKVTGGSAAVSMLQCQCWDLLPGWGEPVAADRADRTALTDIEDKQAKTVGMAKYDLDSIPNTTEVLPACVDAGTAAAAVESCCAVIRYPVGCYGGEAYFVPRHQDPAKCDGEDDGFMVLYVYHSKEDISCFEVYDAKTMSPTPLAQIKLPQRVPYGFHGTWVPEAQLKLMSSA
ncbi:hypothetical protein QJQ45_021212 [Haematococcus lacustris]|nr:hypothetical protein QJQ45_021212 [Haematococcus lacustris]